MIPVKAMATLFDRVSEGTSDAFTWIRKVYLKLLDFCSFQKRIEGVVITDVGTLPFPLNKNEFRAGDIILKYNEKPVYQLSEIPEHFAKLARGATAKLQVIRQGRQLNFSNTKTFGKKSPITTALLREKGLELQDTSEGIILGKVAQGSSYAVAGIQAGSFLTHVCIEKKAYKVNRIADLQSVLQVGTSQISFRLKNGERLSQFIISND